MSTTLKTKQSRIQLRVQRGRCQKPCWQQTTTAPYASKEVSIEISGALWAVTQSLPARGCFQRLCQWGSVRTWCVIGKGAWSWCCRAIRAMIIRFNPGWNGYQVIVPVFMWSLSEHMMVCTAWIIKVTDPTLASSMLALGCWLVEVRTTSGCSLMLLGDGWPNDLPDRAPVYFLYTPTTSADVFALAS